MNKTKIKAALKEIVRLVIFSIPAILIQVITNDPTLTGTYGATILYILRAVDKSIHEDKATPSKGLLPF